MSSNFDSVQMQHSSIEVRSGRLLHAALLSLWRRRLLVVAIVAAALALGIMTIFLMPAQYTAETYIRGVVGGSNTVAKDDTDEADRRAIGLDAGRVLETQTHLLWSYQLAHRVVEHLGLERLRNELDGGTSLLARLFGHAASDPRGQLGEVDAKTQTDALAGKILRNLSVISDPRAYLITISYTDRDPELAVVISNAFVAEFLRSTRLQVLSQQRSAAQAQLSKALVQFGDKHPKVAVAKLGLATIDDLLKEQLNASPDAVLQAAGENVTEARAAPSSPNSRFVIGLFLLVGLIAGFGVVLWLERDRWWRTFSQYYTGPFA